MGKSSYLEPNKSSTSIRRNQINLWEDEEMAIARVEMLMNKVSMGLYEHDKWTFLLLNKTCLWRNSEWTIPARRAQSPLAMNQAPLRGVSHFVFQLLAAKKHFHNFGCLSVFRLFFSHLPKLRFMSIHDILWCHMIIHNPLHSTFFDVWVCSMTCHTWWKSKLTRASAELVTQ